MVTESSCPNLTRRIDRMQSESPLDPRHSAAGKT
jgi:hypothetical protein